MAVRLLPSHELKHITPLKAPQCVLPIVVQGEQTLYHNQRASARLRAVKVLFVKIKYCRTPTAVTRPKVM